VSFTKEQAKEKVLELVREFSELTKGDYSSKSENQIKSEFIDPLFEALGWDMRKDAERETQILRGRSDYILKHGNREVLIIEAKKADVKLEEEQGRQTVSYGYHRKIKFAVLTNFKQIRVFHALSNIKNVFANQLFWSDFQDFERNFDTLWLLSKESFEKGELEKLIPSKDAKTAVPIDERILEDLLQIRKWLSHELKLKRMELKDEYIDEIVQICIDRLIFMRSVEDRGLEGEGFLLKIVEDVQKGLTEKNLWALLKEQFVRFDNTYNSKLFAKGILEEYGVFGDDVLKKVIKTLYYGIEHNYEKYMFDKIPGDLFGNIYEQYLGTILAGTEKRVKLDSSSGKRKKMGIYYTPSYITDYIVKNTVGEYIKNMSVDEILEVNIIDPACGSGSFLIRTFKEVCNKVEELLKEGKFSEKWSSFKDYKGRLNFAQKSTLLKNCIYGVDLDEKAVELAQLNLLLKVFEGEERDLRVRKLPNLYENIKNGNSLIDDIKVAGDKAFNWNAQFKDVFDNGGFDIVVGNPPYVNTKNLSKGDLNIKDFYTKKYRSATGCFDLYIPFIEKSLLITREGGFISFIIPNKILSADYASVIRKIMIEDKLLNIVDVSKTDVFKDASVYPIIFVEQKSLNKEEYNVNLMKSLEDRGVLVNKNELLNSGTIGTNSSIEGNDLLKKMEMHSRKLEEISAMQSGVTGFQAQVVKGLLTDKPLKSKEYVSFVVTKNIDPYIIEKGKLNYMKASFSNPFLELDSNVLSEDKIKMYTSKKIIVGGMTKKIEAGFDAEGMACGVSTYTIISDNLLLLLGLLNSKLINFWYRHKFESKHLAGGYLAIDKGQLAEIPIRLPSPSQEKGIVDLVNQMLELQKKYHDEKVVGGEKDRIKQQIDSIDYEIDQEVYKLYGLTPEEIKIVEESLK